MVRVTNVHEAPVLTGPREVPYREHDTGAVGTYDAADPENDTILWSLRGTDRNDFTITGGVLRFVETPDLEDPVDADPDNEYRLTVRASDGEDTDTLAVTVRVSNEEEAGAVGFSSEQPQVGALLTATLTDPDGGISGDVDVGATAEWEQLDRHCIRHVALLPTGRGRPGPLPPGHGVLQRRPRSRQGGSGIPGQPHAGDAEQ